MPEIPPSPEPLSPVAQAEVWAAAVALQLKWTHARFASAAQEERDIILESVVREALLDLSTELRPSGLKALAQRFPSWDMATRAIFAPAPAAERSSDETINEFFQLVPHLTTEQRDQVRARLSTAELVSTESLAQEVRQEIHTKLKLGPDDEIDGQRLGKLFAGFAEILLALDQLVWNVWKTVAPQSPLRRELAPSDFRALVRRSLCGDAEASAVQVQQQLESTRQLIAGLLAGLGPAGQAFGNRFQARYAPEAIQAAIESEGSAGFFASTEAKCWEKYQSLAAELSAEAIETEVRNAVVTYAEDLIRGRNR